MSTLAGAGFFHRAHSRHDVFRVPRASTAEFLGACWQRRIEVGSPLRQFFFSRKSFSAASAGARSSALMRGPALSIASVQVVFYASIVQLPAIRATSPASGWRGGSRCR
jgi:hypothetical protein